MATAAPAPTETDRRRILVVISGLMLVMLMASLDQTIVSTALPTIVGDLGGLEHISWVVTSYLLAVTVVTPLYGKLGDQYGRKIVLQGSLVIFLIGSALCGQATGMTELILFRGIQGLGGGGLMVSAQAAIGDVVPPRERGRYMGLFGAVFGVSSIAGPLLGGFLTSHFSWRWIFYVNIPVGILAFGVLAVTLPSATQRVRHSIDYLGAGMLAVSLSSLVLLTTLGGRQVAWGSATIVGLAALSIGALVAFCLAERRAAEPILPPHLARNRVFVVTSAIGFVIGFALFGALTYLPLFQQVVRGLSPTESGLALLPLMAGLLVASILSGRRISRTGHYRIYPIVGTALATVGLVLLAQLDENTSTLLAGLYMAVFGVGLGLVMQVLVLAAQNSVSYEDLGVATSGASLFRSIGGSLGTAVLGAVFATHLNNLLAARLPAGAEAITGANLDPAALTQLPAAVRDAYISAFTDTINLVFLVGAGIALVAFGLTWLLREQPLRQTVETAGVAEAFAIPHETDSLHEVGRAVSTLLGREGVVRFLENAAERADLELLPADCYLLARAARDGSVDPAALAAAHDIDAGRLQAALERLRLGDYVTGEDTEARLTERGATAVDALADARRCAVEDLLAEWTPQEHPELLALAAELATEMGEEPPVLRR